MTYFWLLTIFVGVAIVAAVLLYRRPLPSRWVSSLCIAAIVLTVLTIVFDSIMIGADLFTYGERHILGPRIGLMPIEDLSYPIAAVILLPAVWMALGGERDR